MNAHIKSQNLDLSWSFFAWLKKTFRVFGCCGLLLPICVGNLTAALNVGNANTQEGPVVTLAREPAQKMMYGMDFERLWSWDTLKPDAKKQLAQAAVRDCRVQYVRVAVRGAAETKQGSFDPKAYDEIVEMMGYLKAARPDVKFFGSPRPISGEDSTTRAQYPYTCFPIWITKFEVKKDDGKTKKWSYLGFEPELAADYMVRYVRFMQSKGLKISYLDLKNEACKLIKPEGGKTMAIRIREQLGKDCPLLVAPSSFDCNLAVEWMKVSMRDLRTDYFDIASTHNTRESGSLEDLVALARQTGKMVWNTELHSWRGPDSAAATNTVKLLAQIRAGVSGINDWLSLGNQKKDYKMFRALDDGTLAMMRVYYIYKQLVNTSGDGNYVPATIPDGLASSAAFVRGNLMTVWLVNAANVPAKNVKVELGGRSIRGAEVRTLSWGPNNPREGAAGTFSIPANACSFACDVPAETLVCYEFELAANS